MGSSSFRGFVGALTVVGLLSMPAVGVAATAPPRGHLRPDVRIRHELSGNWSGYALTGFGPYESVSASWTQPAVNCAATPTGYAAFWVGLDGYSTDTVEQTGTEADCFGGKAEYGAWYEMYPRDSYSLREPVAAGDSFTDSVTYIGKGLFGHSAWFELTLKDTTQGWSRTVLRPLASAKLASAEAIAEAPSDAFGVLPLSDFGSVGFSGMTVDGSLVSGSTPGVEPITMVSEDEALEAEPSAITGGSFTDNWYSS